MLTGSRARGASTLETQLLDDEAGPDKKTRDRGENKSFKIISKGSRHGCFNHQRRGHGTLVGTILI